MVNIEWDLSELYEFADRLGNLSMFERRMKEATRVLAKALLRRMKSLTPVDEYELINGWEGNKFLVTNTKTGFEVSIVNRSPYGLYVNDGHKAYNQYGGPYPIHTKVTRGPYGKLQGRIKVRSPHQWQIGDSTWYVYGHFFVERGILQLKQSTEIESLIYLQLEKWWEGCING